MRYHEKYRSIYLHMYVHGRTSIHGLVNGLYVNAAGPAHVCIYVNACMCVCVLHCTQGPADHYGRASAAAVDMIALFEDTDDSDLEMFNKFRASSA